MKKSGLEASRSKLELQDLMHNWIDENQHRIFKAYFDDFIVNSIKRERKSLTFLVSGSIKIDQKEKNAVLIASITIRNKHLKSAISMRSTRFILLCSRMRGQIARMFFYPTFTSSRRKTLVIHSDIPFTYGNKNELDDDSWEVLSSPLLFVDFGLESHLLMKLNG